MFATEPPRVIEFFCGIGGAAAALAPWPTKPVLALDIFPLAVEVYRRNFPNHPAQVAEIESFDLSHRTADLWWLSPPCLPFTRRGNQRDWDDPRTQALKSLIVSLQKSRPRTLIIENVPPFQHSRTAAWVCHQLSLHNYVCDWELRCPTELRWPMRRKRCYLIASQAALAPLPQPEQSINVLAPHSSLASYLDKEYPPDYAVPPTILDQYAKAIHIVDQSDPQAITACFTSAYGKSPVRCGSYLRTTDGSLRYFKPTEIARLMGFPDSFSLMACPSIRHAWSLIGNSVSVPVVRWILHRVLQNH